MIVLWHCIDARSFRALWALEEVGAPYRLEMLPFPPRQYAREYLAINPLGTIPLLIDGDARMTESAAICQYLGDRYAGPPLAVSRDEAAYPAYLNALHFGEATLTFPQAIVLRYGQMEPEARRLPQAVADYSRWTLGRMRGLEAMMAGADYVCAGRFTMADVSIGYALMLSGLSGLADQSPPSLQRYFRRLADRPAFQRAKDAQMKAARANNIPIPEYAAPAPGRA
jgi:glutathione S-transferase